jgi:transposase-like protein
MVGERRADYGSEGEAMSSIASTSACTSETLRRWCRTESGRRAAQGVDEKARLKLLEREIKELRRPLEQRVEAVRPFEQGGRVRGLLRHAGGDEPIGDPLASPLPTSLS